MLPHWDARNKLIPLAFHALRYRQGGGLIGIVHSAGRRELKPPKATWRVSGLLALIGDVPGMQERVTPPP